MDNKEIAKEIVGYCISNGTECEVLVQDSVSKSVNVRNGEQESVILEEGRSVSVKIIKDGKTLNVSSNDLLSIRDMLESNLLVIDHMPVDEFVAVNNQMIGEFQNPIDNFDPSIDWLINYSERTESSALRNQEITNSNGSYTSSTHNEVTFMNSNHVYGSYKKSSFANNLAVVAGKEQDMQIGYDFCVSKYHEGLANPEVFGKEIADNTVASMNPKSIENATMPVLLDYHVSSEFIALFLDLINGSHVISDTTVLKNKMNQQVFLNEIEILANPTDIHAVNYRPFDDEGVSTCKMPLVENGVLKNWILDLYTAKKLGLKSNGNASKSDKGITRPSNPNIFIKQDRNRKMR